MEMRKTCNFRQTLRYAIITFGFAAGIISPRFGIAGEGKDEDSRLTIERIYGKNEFSSKGYSARWLDNSNAFTTLEASIDYQDRHDIVSHNPATGKDLIIVHASDLIPSGESIPLKIEDYAWSSNQATLLIYTNSKRVWRRNTRGDYWLLDRSAGQLRRLGGNAKPASMMFAKFSPSGHQIAYVQDRDIYIQNLIDFNVKRLTHAVDKDEINGTTDWVYEEEFSLRDGFRWSPDGKSIAYWQLNTQGVQKFPLINNIDSLYPEVTWFAYPKVGQINPKCRIGVIDISSEKTIWVRLPEENGDYYIPRIDWTKDSQGILVQRLNRLQNTNSLYLADVNSGDVEPILTETDDAWVDVNDEMTWLPDGKKFTWISERDGWRHIFLASPSGGDPILVTPVGFDVIKLLRTDEVAGRLYFIASPDDAASRYLYRIDLDGQNLQRITPEDGEGTHVYDISPNSCWAIIVGLRQETHLSPNWLVYPIIRQCEL